MSCTTDEATTPLPPGCHPLRADPLRAADVPGTGWTGRSRARLRTVAAWLLWLIAAGLFAAGEVASLDLVLLMFAGGALGGVVVALLGGAVAIQLVAFVAGGGGRPFFVPPVAPGAPGGGAAPPPGGGGPRGGAP